MVNNGVLSKEHGHPAEVDDVGKNAYFDYIPNFSTPFLFPAPFLALRCTVLDNSFKKKITISFFPLIKQLSQEALGLTKFHFPLLAHFEALVSI